jgi:hypothetical protein
MFGMRKNFMAVGYPKTGNTWLRYLLGQYVCHAYDLSELPLFDPAEKKALKAAGYKGPFGSFTHAPLTWDTQTAADLNFQNTVAPFKGQRVLLLARHPLDVVVSHYMHMRYRLDSCDMDLMAFATDPVWGLEKMAKFYKLWAQRSDNVHMVRYEALSAAAAPELEQIIKFTGMRHDAEAVKKAVENASFENMKGLENKGSTLQYKSSGYTFLAKGKSESPEAQHVRKGKVGGYQDYFTPEQSATLLQTYMPEFMENYKQAETKSLLVA